MSNQRSRVMISVAARQNTRIISGANQIMPGHKETLEALEARNKAGQEADLAAGRAPGSWYLARKADVPELPKPYSTNRRGRRDQKHNRFRNT